VRPHETTMHSVGERLEGDPERERGVRREAPNNPEGESG
jgi:hypothetical protein